MLLLHKAPAVLQVPVPPVRLSQQGAPRSPHLAQVPEVHFVPEAVQEPDVGFAPQQA